MHGCAGLKIPSQQSDGDARLRASLSPNSGQSVQAVLGVRRIPRRPSHSIEVSSLTRGRRAQCRPTRRRRSSCWRSFANTPRAAAASRRPVSQRSIRGPRPGGGTSVAPDATRARRPPAGGAEIEPRGVERDACHSGSLLPAAARRAWDTTGLVSYSMIPLLPRPELVDGPAANSVSGGGGLNHARLLNVRVASLVL